MPRFATLLLALAMAAVTAACGGSESTDTGAQPDSAAAPVPPDSATLDEAPPAEEMMVDPSSLPGEPLQGTLETTASGLQIAVQSEGTGATASGGQTVSVHYSGYLLDGTLFDSSQTSGQPIEFMLGFGQVIDGWDEGLEGMTVGEKRKLVIPPALAYGESGFPPVIPANSILVFDVEMMDVK